MVTRQQLLGYLPPFDNKMQLIEGSQEVPDIIGEVVESHKVFAPDYDRIYKFFDNGSIREICRRLFEFCKKNIVYVVEGVQQQTTKSPSAVLAQGFGDCKHYAGMIGGVLSAIVRNTGREIPWKYRFASYSPLTRDPGHVFIVASDQNGEIWIDPVLKRFDERLQPVYITDYKIKDMPLYRVSGLPARVGIDPVSIAMVAKDIYTFVKAFGGDKVPNYPIKSTDTLQKIRDHIATLIQPFPPQTLADAYRVKEIIENYMDEIAGNNDNVVKTYYMIYGEYLAAVNNYIMAQTGAGGTVDPNTGKYTPPPQTAAAGMFGNPMLLAALGIGALLFLSRGGGRRKR